MPALCQIPNGEFKTTASALNHSACFESSSRSVWGEGPSWKRESNPSQEGAYGEEEACGDRVYHSQEQKHLCVWGLSRDVLHIWNCRWQVQLWSPGSIFLLVLRLLCTGHWHPSTGSPCGSGGQGRGAEYSLEEGGGSPWPAHR